jgi:uncharacterized protein DUF1569
MRSLLEDECRARLLARLRRLGPESRAQWGRMSAPQMLAHLGDQMRLMLGDMPSVPRRHSSRLSYPGIKHAWLYVLPWPKDRVRGPREAFVTQPSTWSADVAALEALVARFVARGPTGTWPAHPYFGPLSGREWGVFCFRHFDHHFRQFGA